ncbi:Tyrosine phenol-lyase [Enhygromyxa salina]|uniref:Tyrosine phenol-lyase n=1 Tax=Enhygromyxa salina TaxID=215803 RepID=A0A2S9YJS5_9BACT|nr:tryptophanase [Enhygromyxa salina]PRQ05276.1 Tyrosine phenol-lyase [Enhygromyxa salina]
MTTKQTVEHEEEWVEPYRTKVVERIHLPSRAERERLLREANYSIVFLNSADVYIDLVTDSGTGAMSDKQWAALMQGDEAYMGSRNFADFEKTVQEITGYDRVIPTHQGRAAERIMMELLVSPGDIVPNNSHFDTTRAHVGKREAVPLDLVGDWLWEFHSDHPFKGNFDLDKLKTCLDRYSDRIPFVAITVLNNMACSSPVSMANIREVSRLAKAAGVPVYFDACRFAENAWFIKQREEGYADRSIDDIVREMFSYGDGCWMSAKKDGIVNIGGFIALRDEALAGRCCELLVLYEGFPSYGGLARRDLAAIAVGLREGMSEEHLSHRIRQVQYLADLFEDCGVRTSRPVGGSGVFVDTEALYPHLTPDRLPTVTLCCDLYLEGGVRAGAIPMDMNVIDEAGEITTRVFQFARFAVPRRVYGKGHLDYVGRVVRRVKENAARSKGYQMVYVPDILPHFFARFAPF